jgi:hypothetical protein
LDVTAYRVKWTDLDIAHWQTRIENSYHQILKVYPDGCLGWLKEFEPGRVAALKATVENIKRAYTDRDSQGLDAALTSYQDIHLKTFEEYLAKSSVHREA